MGDLTGVLGQLTIQIRTYPWRTRTRAVAANLLLDTEHALWREVRPAYMRTRDRVRTDSAAVPVTEIATDLPHNPRAAAEEMFGQADSHDETELDLVDLPLWAERTGVVDARDLSMLVDYYYARESTGAGHEHVAHRRTGPSERGRTTAPWRSRRPPQTPLALSRSPRTRHWGRTGHVAQVFRAISPRPSSGRR